MAPSKTESAPASSCAGEATPKSFNYTARGERVEPRGGIYWIPASEFACAIEASRATPAVLNRYAFVPSAAPCRSRR